MRKWRMRQPTMPDRVARCNTLATCKGAGEIRVKRGRSSEQQGRDGGGKVWYNCFKRPK